MALRFFRQRDIDAIDVEHIPEEFVQYFETLDDAGKTTLVGTRPELAEALGFFLPDIEIDETQEMSEAVTEETGETSENQPDEETEEYEEEADNEFEEISHNLYDSLNLEDTVLDNLQPLEALAVEDGQKRCSLHRTAFKIHEIRYIAAGYPNYGMKVRVCTDCNRLFIEESKITPVHNALTERMIQHTFYDLSLTNRFLRSKMPSHFFSEDEVLYYPDIWIEERPICPIHESLLFEVPCEKTYKDRAVSFTGYCCEACKKILIRRSEAVKLSDACAANGVPQINFERLARVKPEKKPVSAREVKPDYLVDNGKREEYTYNFIADCYRLTEKDTVVINDSIYCSIEGHDTEEVLAFIWVAQKRGGRKGYLFRIGYCSECEKYYMDEIDYKLVQSIGRLEVTILSNIDDHDYQITSGDIFDLERKHLGDVEDEIIKERDAIYSKPDYVSRYQTGSYDDGNLNAAKNHAIQKYGPRLEALTSYIPKPYLYRVDISNDETSEVYYIGAVDITLDGKKQVISANSDFGHELINYQTITLSKDGMEYHIKLSRQFDIDNASLYGYVNLRTDEDLIFKSGITDPFLVRVLNMRKRQHNLTDIFVTIQENQNRIVNTDFKKNLIVQGCAGSGKTMVLLHRLSSLNYKEKGFNFSESALILTPNDQFSLHIKGIAEELQIGGIERASVEQYYADQLGLYDKELRPTSKLVSEMLVRQVFVDYIYSDQFREDFSIAYEKVITDRNALAEILDNLTEAMGRPNRHIDFSNDSGVVQQMRYGVEAMDNLVKRQEEEIEEAKTELEKKKDRKSYLENMLPETLKMADEYINKSLPIVHTKVETYLSDKRKELNTLQNELDALYEERERVQRTIIMFGKRARLEELDGSISDTEHRLHQGEQIVAEERAVLETNLEGKTDEEITSWMRQVMLIIPSVQEEIHMGDQAKEDCEKLVRELAEIDVEIAKLKENVEQRETERYPEEVHKAIRYLYDQLDTYSLIGTYQLVFEAAVSKFKEEYKIGNIVGNFHRYDLYARLLFAMKYYNETHGSTRFMCIDEGQDLALNEYRLLYELNQHNVVLNIFGDTNQLMKPGRGISDWSDLSTAFHTEIYTLNENYRNTNQITRFCNRSFDMDVKRTGADGPNVREIQREELERELAGLRITTERIAILVPRGVQKGRYLDKTILPESIRSIIGDRIDNGYISVMYVDEVKGIEFDKAYVIANKMSRNEKYIAYTRALSELILVLDEKVADYEQGQESVKLKKQNRTKKKETNHANVISYKKPAIEPSKEVSR